MFNTFLISFRLKVTYRVNSIIYRFKQIPVLKNYLPRSLYKSQGLKVFATILSVLWEIISIFLGKIIYFGFFFLLPLTFITKANFNSFIQLLFFLSLSGAIINTGMFEVSKDKYYAVILMKMDGRQFVLSQYLYTILRHYLGSIPCLIFLSFTLNYPIWFSYLIPLTIIGLKLLVVTIKLQIFKKDGRIRSASNNSPLSIGLSIGSILMGYALIYLNLILPVNMILGVYIILIIVGIMALIYVLQYTYYHQLSHKLLSNADIMLNTNTQEIITASYRKMITLDTNIISNKSGFEYFNELFMQRHKKILWKSAKRQALIVGVIVIVIMGFIYIDPVTKKDANNTLTNMLPYFVFIMYLMNTAKNITQAMFINCDHCMLTYSFYRVPKNILDLFKIRLREIVKINLLPTIVLASGYVVILLFTGGSNQIIYAFISFISIISMSIFFSTHYLTLYYLLQPYNAHTAVKSPVYTTIVSLTYIVCYTFTNLKLPIFSFGIVCILFCLSYCIIACILVYKNAWKTFRIRK